MAQRTLTGQRLIVLFIFGWLLFNKPLLALFSHGNWFGIPAVYAYLFITWALLIALLGWTIPRQTRPRRTKPDQSGQ